MVTGGPAERRRSSPGQPYGRPIEKVNVQDVAKEADTDYLDEDITLSLPPGLLRIMVQLDTAAKFYAQCTCETGVKQLVLNRNRDLVQHCLYVFDVLVGPDDSINFQADDDATLDKLIVQEIPLAG